MGIRRLWGYGALVVAVIATVYGVVDTAYANTLTSPNYQLTETQFGNSSTIDGCSEEYCSAQVSIGDNLAAGPSTATFEDVTVNEPFIEVIIEAGESNLGVLSLNTTATKTMGIKIRNYLSEGYALQIHGEPPRFGDHTLAALGQSSAPRAGTEQFGLNVVANTAPSVGANPVQVPDNGTIFGVAADGYNTPNLYKYVSGDNVARSTAETGRTDYIISMIVNVAGNTPAGEYTTDFMAMVVPAF